MGADAPEVQFYDIQSRRKRGGGMYLCDARLLLGDGSSVVLEDGWAGRVPARQALQLIATRSDLYAVPSADQSTPEVVDISATPELTEADFEPLPPGAISGQEAQVSPAVVDGHRVPPGRTQISEEEKARRVALAQQELAALPPHERPGADVPEPPPPATSMLASDGQPILVPFGVVPGSTPGWPADDHGQPLRLTDEQRTAAAAEHIAKTGGDAEGTVPSNPEADERAITITPTPPAPAADAGGYSPPAPEPTPPAPDADESTEVLLAPLPTGFEAKTASDEPRCLATKGDSSQCQNAARPPEHPQACHLPPHQKQVDEMAERHAAQTAAA